MSTGMARTTSESPGRDMGYYQVALALMEQQSFRTMNQLAKAVGCSYYTVRRWWVEVPEFKTLFKNSRQNAVDEVIERSFERAITEDKPSDLMAIYIMNNFDEEIVERTTKNRGAEITIHIDVPSVPQTVEGFARLVQELPPADYRVLDAPNPQTTESND